MLEKKYVPSGFGEDNGVVVALAGENAEPET